MLAPPRFAVAALALMLTTPALAQVTTADIVGRVTDSSGAVLPGVTVTAENLGTHETRVAPTGGSGEYAFTLLPIIPFVGGLLGVIAILVIAERQVQPGLRPRKALP